MATSPSQSIVCHGHRGGPGPGMYPAPAHLSRLNAVQDSMSSQSSTQNTLCLRSSPMLPGAFTTTLMW